MATLKLLATAAKVSPAVRRWSASARWCAVSFGLRPNLTPFAKVLATFPRTFADEFTLEFSDRCGVGDFSDTVEFPEKGGDRGDGGMGKSGGPEKLPVSCA